MFSLRILKSFSPSWLDKDWRWQYYPVSSAQMGAQKGLLKTINTSTTFRKLGHLPQILARVWRDGSRPAVQRQWEKKKKKKITVFFANLLKSAAKNEVGIEIWISFDLWKQDLNSGKKRYRMIATQGSSISHLDATDTDTEQQRHLSSLQHPCWGFKSNPSRPIWLLVVSLIHSLKMCTHAGQTTKKPREARKRRVNYMTTP